MIRCWGSCITCHWMDDKVVKKEDGTTEVKPFCLQARKEIPSYEYKPKFCLGYSMSAEYREKYADD